MLVYAVLVAGLVVTSWLTWKAYKLGPLGTHAAGGVLSWGASGLLYFLATRVVPECGANLIEFVWLPLFLGYAFFIFLLGSLPSPKNFPIWLYALALIPVTAFLMARPYTSHETQLATLFALQLLLLYYALPRWYALTQGEAPEGRAIWVPVLIFFGSGITTWFALTPSYNDTVMVLAAFVWLLGLWLLVAGLELETTGRTVSLSHLTGVTVGFMTMWMLLLNQWCLSGKMVDNLQQKLWLTVVTLLTGALSIFLPLYLFKRRSERRLARWGSILSRLTTFLWRQENPSPTSIARELFNLLRRGSENVAGVRLAVFDNLVVGEKTSHGLTMKDGDLVLGRVYLYDPERCDGLLKTILPLATQRLGEVVRSLNWRSQAQTDPLTGLFNRRGFEINVHYLVERASQEKKPVTVGILDIDHFKQVNDSLGHSVGDRLLQEVAKVLKNSLRSEDLAVRWGGEEFLAILANSDITQAQQVFERIRKRISSLRIPGLDHPLTASVGLAGSRAPQTVDEIYEWIERADLALKKAKEGGRDRIEKDD